MVINDHKNMATKRLIFETLTDELRLAKKWSRPSITLLTAQQPYGFLDAFYNLSLVAGSLGLNLVHIHLQPNSFDFPQLVRKHGKIAQSLFVCTGLDAAGGVDNANAYKALNIRREWFVEDGMMAVICPTPSETRRLPQLAPDFWAFRHHAYAYPNARKLHAPWWLAALPGKTPVPKQIQVAWALSPQWLGSAPGGSMAGLASDFFSKQTTVGKVAVKTREDALLAIKKHPANFTKEFIKYFADASAEKSR